MKFIVRFSPLLYPTVGGFGKDSGGQKLITDLCQAARSHGNCALISNGSSAKACKDQRVLLCMAVSIISVWMVPKPMLIV